MKTVKTAPALDRLVGPLGECLTPECTIAEIEAAIEHLSAQQVEELAIWLDSHQARRANRWLPMPG